jgi:hypothetical protein
MFKAQSDKLLPQPGYLYVLVHPCKPNLIKVGGTILKPEERLAQHNNQYDKYAGRIVKETGQKWELKTYIEVPDPYWAEKAFWRATPLSDVPFRGGIEVDKMTWEEVKKCLEAAKKAGLRPLPKPRLTPVRNQEWMIKQLEGSGITMMGRYGGLVRHTEFKCTEGHVFKTSAGKLANSKFCPHCVV